MLSNESKRVLPATLALFLPIVFVINLAMGGVISYISISSRGTVLITLGVGAYWDDNCSKPVMALDWGTIEPNYLKKITMHLRNEGNVEVTLNLSVTNWYPQEASNYIALDWDYDGRTLSPSEITEVTLVLSVSSAIKGVADFGFDIIIAPT